MEKESVHQEDNEADKPGRKGILGGEPHFTRVG